MNVGELLLYCGQLIVPVIFWFSILALLAIHLESSQWSRESKIALFWFLALASLLFLILLRVSGKNNQPNNITVVVG